MTVSVTGYKSTLAGSSGSSYKRISGTIAEVVQELANEGISAERVVSYVETSPNAVALVCLKR